MPRVPPPHVTHSCAAVLSGKACRTWQRGTRQRGLRSGCAAYARTERLPAHNGQPGRRREGGAGASRGFNRVQPWRPGQSRRRPRLPSTCCRNWSLYALPSAVCTMYGMLTACGAWPATNSSCVLRGRGGREAGGRRSGGRSSWFGLPLGRLPIFVCAVVCPQIALATSVAPDKLIELKGALAPLRLDGNRIL